MSFNRRRDREMQQRLRGQKRYASRNSRLPMEQALLKIQTRILNGATRSSDFSGYGDVADKYYNPAHFTSSRDVASEMTTASGLADVEDDYYNPDEDASSKNIASKMTIASSFAGVSLNAYKPLLVIVGFLGLVCYLSKR